MFRDLENLSNTFTTVTWEQAQSIIGTINGKLRIVLIAQIIDILYREDTKDGILLRPLVSKVAPDITREAVVPWPVDKDSKGIWPWVYFNQKPIWIENIIELRKQGKVAQNKIGKEDVSFEDLDEIYVNTDSIMAIPLVFNRTVEGVYCIELSNSNILDTRILELMERLAKSFASLIWKMKVNELNTSQASLAIEHFKATISEMVLHEYIRSTQKGIFIRPFGEGFNKVENCVKETFAKQKIEVEHYVAGHASHIPEDIVTKIKLTPFGVADISGYNPNVMVELGMLQALSKDKFLLINKKETQEELPFDIRTESVHYYEIIGNDIHVTDPATSGLIRLEEKLNSFISDLKAKGKLH